MADETKESPPNYEALLGNAAEVTQVVGSLQVIKKNQPVPKSSWFNKLDMAPLFVNAFKVALITLSTHPGNCTTYLPSRDPPREEFSPIFMIFVNGNHWVWAELQAPQGQKVPIPPIANWWNSSRHTSRMAKHWKDQAEDALALWKQLDKGKGKDLG